MKNLSDIFPGLKTQEPLTSLMKAAEVERIAVPEDMSEIVIFICCRGIVSRMTIDSLEKELKKQVFPLKKVSINIREHFVMSAAFTAEKLYEAYRDSILYELKHKDLIEFRIMNRAKITFPPDDTMEISVEKMAFNLNVIDDLISYLQDTVFSERFGLKVTVKPDYVEYVLPAAKSGEQETVLYKDIPAPAEKKEAFLIPGEKKEKAENPSEMTVPASSGKKKKSYHSWHSDNPDVLYGRDFEDKFTDIKDLLTVAGEVNIRGQIFDLSSRYLEKHECTMFLFSVTDFTDSISAKMFVNNEELEQVKSALEEKRFIKLRGNTTTDNHDGELIISPVRSIKKCEPFCENARTDNAKVKRVELHCHTKMSDLDAVSSATDIINQAKNWGMDAIAITDHGNVQAFPEAWKLVGEHPESFPKIIYGVEGYLVDDLKELVTNPREYTLDSSFVVFDLETTGFSPVNCSIIEIGAVKVENGEVTKRFSTFVNPDMPIPFRIEQLTGISDADVKDAPKIDQVLPSFISFCEGCAVVAHNASFDTGFIRESAKRLNLPWNPAVLDTVSLAHLLLPNLTRYKLDTVAKALNVSLQNHHRAVDDAECTAGIFVKFIGMLKERGLHTLKEVAILNETNADMVKKSNTYHVIILIKNETGRINLYRLISYSHIDYFFKKPRIPKSVLQKYREGLIVGSACEAGEIFQALLRGESPEEMDRLANFYDYLEIQPVGNNHFMIDDEHYPVKSDDDIREINKKIVQLGERYRKPVVATCDVHFLNPQDEIYRRMIFYENKYDNADSQPPLYLRTTDEMLQEFSYLGPEKCEEVVITNTRKIADSIDRISPVRPDKCPPVIPDSDKKLKESCYRKAHEQYGDKLPKIVEDRLEKELSSIIKNGFAVMYIIAQELVKHSNEEGYLVGSRGSVGSSFVAYTAGITEVNPLPPHYYCPKCRYSDFESEMPKKYAGTAGCDMPDKICPVCGEKLKKDGFDIPFETFLGFKGDKEPDIDLNFSGENQASAHAYTEVIFGKGQTFRAGTVGTLADKTAFGYVKHYFENHGERKRKCEINRLVKGCVGIRRTTGQHPGGIIVLPKGESIYSFTPIQHPANDMTTKITTTHFEYHAISHNLLKLDILGHQDPTMIRMLQDLTGIDPVKDIPLDSKEVMSLFEDTSALKVRPEDIMGCKLGALGIPEFGTDFAMNMLLEAKPKGFSDLVRIAGLAHGTDVWNGNAQTLIEEKKATIQTAICTRDDIMTHLIQTGLDPQEAFKIMESVRKGRGLTPEWEKDMIDKGVPAWYIWSCKKIKYMFPKAHAAAYVMMAWRIGYCKIFYPLAYYASYFSIRATGFSYEIMCHGKQQLESFLSDLMKRNFSNNRENPLSPKEEDMLRDGRVVQEMYARGFEFLPIDIYRAQATKFSLIDGKIMPSLTSIDGLGETAAVQIAEAAAKGDFISKDDFMNRTKTGPTTVELFDRLGILGKMPDSNQLSIFDMMKA